MSAPRPLLGVLAGGRGRRMGGRDKAQLQAPGGIETLLGRLVRIGGELGLDCVVLGGPARDRLLVLPDQPAESGPIGGLHALVAYAGDAPVVALACDMPYVSAALLGRLVQVSSSAPVVAARDPGSGKWEPWFARYDSARVRQPLAAAIAQGERSMQRFLRTLAVEELALQPGERALLRDWDEPSDIAHEP